MESEAARSPAQSGIAQFFALTFAFTWLLQAPAVAAKSGLLPGGITPYLPLAVLGVLGPAAAASVLTAREGGRPALRALYARLLVWRVPLRYYVMGLLAPGLGLSAILWLLRLAGREGPIAYLPDVPHLVAALVIALGEEIGWRGFALPRLRARFGSLAASGVIGSAWTLWHIPMFVGAGVPLSLLVVMLLYFTGGSLLFTWIYEGTGESLLLVLFGHVGAHLDNSHAALPGDVIPVVVHAIVYAGLGFLVLRRATTPPRRSVSPVPRVPRPSRPRPAEIPLRIAPRAP
jgi:membrane protease YdiL (CAAX protease family)